jgi:hypothetical protein
MNSAVISAVQFRENPAIASTIVDRFLDGSNTGTIWLHMERNGFTESEVIQKQRVEKWIKDRWDNGGDFADTVYLLLDFENYLLTESTLRFTESKEKLANEPAGNV